MSGFSLIWIRSSLNMNWKDGIMMDYGKTKKSRWKSALQLDKIDSWISIGWLVSTCLPQWFDLFNHNLLEQKHRGRIWLVITQALQILWASVHVLTHALNNFCRLYGRQLNLTKHLYLCHWAISLFA